MVGAALVPPDYFTTRGGTWPRPVSLVERPASSRVWGLQREAGGPGWLASAQRLAARGDLDEACNVRARSQPPAGRFGSLRRVGGDQGFRAEGGARQSLRNPDEQ